MKNDVVNLSLCKSISKGKFSWYPDNEGIPSIIFRGTKIEWVFNNNQQRDTEFGRIVSMFGEKS